MIHASIKKCDFLEPIRLDDINDFIIGGGYDTTPAFTGLRRPYDENGEVPVYTHSYFDGSDGLVSAFK